MSTTLRTGPPMVDADWYAFCQALYKGIEVEDREEMCDSCQVMSRAMGVTKAAGGPEGESLVGHESSQRQKGKSFMIRLAKRTFRKGMKRDWSCGTSISRIPLLRWIKHSNALKVSTEANVGSRLL